MTAQSTPKPFTLWTLSALALPLAGCGEAVVPAQDGNSVALASLRLQPGLWQQSGGRMAALASKAGESSSRCITPREALAANGTDAEIRTELEQSAAKAGCTLKGVTIQGPLIAYEQMCTGTLVKTEVTYLGTSLSMVMTMAGLPRITSEERRIGDC